MNDRAIGYVVLVALLLFTAICIATVGWVFFSPRETRTIKFDHVGSLKIDDPVRVSGADVGKISAVDFAGGNAVITIQSSGHIAIFTDYKISMVDLGLMGDRAVVLYCGNGANPELPVKDTLQGSFIMGPSEAIGLMYKLRETVVGFVEVSNLFMNGKGSSASLITQISKTINYLDSISNVITAFSQAFDTDIASGLDTLSRLIGQTAVLSATVSSNLPSAIASIDTLTIQLEKTLQQADTLLVLVKPMVNKLSGPEALKWQNQINELINQVGSIEKLLENVEKKGVPLKIRL